MLKVIDLDAQGKDSEGFVFTLTLGNEKFGITDQEVIELIRAKHGAPSKGGGKRSTQRRGAQAADNASDTMNSDTQSADATADSDSHTASDSESEMDVHS